MSERDELLAALKPFAEFKRQWNRKPIRQDNTIYAIHIGTEWEAELTHADLQRALDVYDALSRVLPPEDQEPE